MTPQRHRKALSGGRLVAWEWVDRYILRFPPQVPGFGPIAFTHGFSAMSDIIAPQAKVTFTIKKAPRREAERKTIQRLMRKQTHIQTGLRHLARQRRQKDNRPYIRAGVEWVDRVKTTKLTKVEPGETFTLTICPQIMPDLRSVEKYLDAAKAK